MKQAIRYYLKIFLFTGIMAGVCNGVFQALGGDETVNGLLLTMAVQLSPTLAWLATKDKSPAKLSLGLKADKWLLAAILIPSSVLAAAAAVLSLTGMPYQRSAFVGELLPVAVITTVIGSIGEEIGWRGYLQSLLERRHSPFVSSAITGLMWGAWHFFKIMNVGFLAYLLFIPTIVLFGILMGYVYHKSGRSLANMVIFHSFVNLTTIALLYGRESIPFYLALTAVELAAVAGLMFIDKDYFRSKHQ